MTEPATLKRDIAAGEVYKYTGSLIIDGNIGAGARVEIEDGGLRVKGNVADGASLEANNGGGMTINNGVITIFGSINGMVTNINGKTIPAGRTITADGESINGISGVTVDGTVGNKVTLASDTNICLKREAGDDLKIKATTINVDNTGANFQATATGTLTANQVGMKARLKASGTIEVYQLGNGSTADAGGIAKVGNAGENTNVRAGGMAQVSRACKNATVVAGGMVDVMVAHTTATVQAGGMAQVHVRSSNDADFVSLQTSKPNRKTEL